jgi:hypothetical protein
LAELVDDRYFEPITQGRAGQKGTAISLFSMEEDGRIAKELVKVGLFLLKFG